MESDKKKKKNGNTAYPDLGLTPTVPHVGQWKYHNKDIKIQVIFCQLPSSFCFSGHRIKYDCLKKKKTTKKPNEFHKQNNPLHTPGLGEKLWVIKSKNKTSQQTKTRVKNSHNTLFRIHFKV